MGGWGIKQKICSTYLSLSMWDMLWKQEGLLGSLSCLVQPRQCKTTAASPFCSGNFSFAERRGFCWHLHQATHTHSVRINNIKDVSNMFSVKQYR